MMASGSVKLGVTGIGEFKSAMNQARNATKTLDAEMKLAQAQFRATGDAETYLQQRTTILTQQIDQQQAALDAARAAMERMDSEGVDPASASYQQMQRAAFDAEREMIRLRQEADKTGEELLDSSTDADKLKESLDSINKSTRFTAMATGLKAVGVVAKQVWESIKNVVNAFGEAADWADDLITSATKYGMGTEELQRYQYASRFVDTEVDAILKARDRLMQKTKDQGVLFLVDGMDQYSIKLKNADGSTRDTMDTFWDFIDTLSKMSDETARDQLAQEYFGKSFRDLIPLITAGREAWEKYMNEAKVVSDDDVKKLGDLDDSMERLDNAWQTFGRTIMADLAPALTTIIDKLTSAYTWASNAADAVLRFFGIIDDEEPGSSFNLELGGGRAEALKRGAERAAEEGAQAGETAVNAFATGAAETSDAAYAAGLALGSAVADGFAAAAAAGMNGGNTTNYNSTQNFGDTYNIYGNSAEDAAAAARRQAAGYGG